MPHPYESVIQDKLEAILAASYISRWRFRIGAPEGAQAPEFNDDDWETVKLPFTWSSADGEGWFRVVVSPPPAVEGIALAGSAVELVMFLTIGAAIYVNGVEVRREASWTDTRAVALVLQENYQPGAPLCIVVRANAGDGFGAFIGAGLRFSALADAAFDLDLVRMQLRFTRLLAERGDAGGLATWERAAAALDLDALAACDWLRWQASVAEAHRMLAPFAAQAKFYTAHLVAHSHIDMNWLWPMRETIEVCRRDFSSVDRLMDRYPEFHFSQSQAAVYQAMEVHDPALFARIRTRVGEGRWEITATNWVEGDLNMACGEALVRHVLHTRRYIGDRFGVEPPICWEPDTFGHTANYPQILAKSGIRFYYFCRAGKRHPLFWWEGLDGSRVLAVQDLRGYGGDNDPSGVVGSVLDFAEKAGIARGLYVYGAGDHGGGATARDIEYARRIDAAPFVPRALPSTAVAFYEKALEEAEELPVVRGEMNTVFEGCYTSHGDIKRLNRDGENSLLTAEAIAALTTLWTGAPYPREELAEAWRTLCFHQFHDILCGCAIGVTYREARERLEEVLNTAQRTTTTALQALAAAVDTGEGAGPRLVVVNPLAWTRSDVVRVPLAQWGAVNAATAPAALEDDSGRQVPVQILGEEMIFIAEEVPALGMRVYHAASAGSPPAPVSAAAAPHGQGVTADGENLVLDNGIPRLRVHPASGALAELIDHETGQDMAGPWVGWGPEARINAGMLNRLQIVWEQPHPMSAWNIGDTARIDHLITGADARVVESGPVCAIVEVRRQFLHSALTQRIALYRGLRRIDFTTEVDWHERGSAHTDAPMLRATFTPFLEQSTATFEVAFAAIERAADGREVPALRWADVSERSGGYGVSLLNDGKYGHQAHGNTLGLTLLRASYEPDNNPDEGLHRFTYALYPHRGTWREAGTAQRAAELNQPLLAVVTDGHAGSLSPGQAGVECDAPGAIVSAVKLAEEQGGKRPAAIVRVYELHGRPTRGMLRLGWPARRAAEVDLIERVAAPEDAALPVRKGVLRLRLAAHEIKTFRIE